MVHIPQKIYQVMQHECISVNAFWDGNIFGTIRQDKGHIKQEMSSSSPLGRKNVHLNVSTCAAFNYHRNRYASPISYLTIHKSWCEKHKPKLHFISDSNDISIIYIINVRLWL